MSMIHNEIKGKQRENKVTGNVVFSLIFIQV